jgi:hypothetical protein
MAAIFSDGRPSDWRSPRSCGRCDRIGRAHIGDDLDALAAQAAAPRASVLEQRIVTAVGIFHARLLRQRHGALTEALEYQIMDVALFGELDCGLDAIARIAGTGSYSNRSHTMFLRRGVPSF